MVPGTDYRFRDDMKEDTVPIELLLEPYNGIVLRYTTVGISENADGTATLKFSYDLYEMGEYTETHLRNNKKFEAYLGLVLNSMILDSTGAADGNDNREDDPQEPNQE